MALGPEGVKKAESLYIIDLLCESERRLEGGALAVFCKGHDRKAMFDKSAFIRCAERSGFSADEATGDPLSRRRQPGACVWVGSN